MQKKKWVQIRQFKEYYFSGKYEIDNRGNIRNVKTKKPLKTYENNVERYLKTKITDVYGKRRALYIHQLVAYYFIKNENFLKMDVDHIDGNKKNNYFKNLRYLTHAENVRAYWRRRANERSREKTAC